MIRKLVVCLLIINSTSLLAFDSVTYRIQGYRHQGITEKGERLDISAKESLNWNNLGFEELYEAELEITSARFIFQIKTPKALLKNREIYFSSPSEITVSDVKYRKKLLQVKGERDLSFLSLADEELKVPQAQLTAGKVTRQGASLFIDLKARTWQFFQSKDKKPVKF